MAYTDTKRTFIAIKVTPDSYFLKGLKRSREALSSEEIRWVDPTNFHITLRFIGDTNSENMEKISKFLSGLAGNFSPFNLTLKGVDVFRSLNHPRVIFAGIQDIEILSLIKKELDSNFDETDNGDTSKSFSPHLTLGRMKRIKNRDSLRKIVEEFQDFEFLQVETEEIIFFESVQNKGGVVYIPISRHSLTGID